MCIGVSGSVLSGPFFDIATLLHGHNHIIYIYIPIQSQIHILVNLNKFYIHSSLVQVDVLEHGGIYSKNSIIHLFTLTSSVLGHFLP